MLKHLQAELPHLLEPERKEWLGVVGAEIDRRRGLEVFEAEALDLASYPPVTAAKGRQSKKPNRMPG